ncbi:energy-coupling factor ABC transporter ATP-binding protein [Corynebacterium sp. 35RC1]|nr:energy-coupling factor ABC transporter ATP-binding protein [Corynebacterium sp. 35RC1]
MPGEVVALGYGYRHASRKNPAFTGLDFHIRPGQRVLLLGPSGAGKSTLLAAIAGLDDEGEHFGKIAATGTVGMVLQDPDSQVIASKVGDDVAFGCENLQVPREEIWRRVPLALQKVGLDLPLDYPTAQLSGGQKQRLALAGVLAMGADIVLLDEPTANLDPTGVEEVVRAVAAVDATVIIVEHRVSTWIEQVDTLMVLTETGSVIMGPPEEILAEHGQWLAEQGVWIPGQDPHFPPAIAKDAPAVIETRDLVVGWDAPVNGPLNLHFPEGVSTVITGPNGAGKSTLLLTLAGLLPPQSGQVRVNLDLGPDPWKWKSAQLAQRFGYVFQDPEHQFVTASVEDELGGQGGDLLARLGLAHLGKANPFTLSGGQKRRLSVATCLVNSPKVVFLDEPTFGQDRTTFCELVGLLRELTDRGTTVISVSHDPLYCRAMGDKVVAL